MQGFHITVPRASWSVRTRAHQPGRRQPGKDSPWEGGGSVAVSLPPVTAVGFVFQSLQASTFLGVIWNKEFGQSESRKAFIFQYTPQDLNGFSAGVEKLFFVQSAETGI